MTGQRNQRPIRSFVRREGRLTPGQARALEEQLYRYEVPQEGPLDPALIFPDRLPVVLDIGFGNGRALVEMAQSQPDWNFLGIEVYRPGAGSLVRQLDELAITNVRIALADAMELLPRIKAGSFDRITVFFPDPWPKKRHHKRRLIQGPFAEQAGRVLSSGGALHLATDWEDYARHMLEVFDRSSGFSNMAGPERYSEKPSYRPRTKYESRGEMLGHQVFDLMFRRS